MLHDTSISDLHIRAERAVRHEENEKENEKENETETEKEEGQG